jgi:hypothetical protein
MFPVAICNSLSEPSEDEEDILDVVFGLTEKGRCQITVTEQMDVINAKATGQTCSESTLLIIFMPI